MTVGGADHAELVRVGAEFRLEHQAALQRFTRVLAGQHFGPLGFAEIEIALVPGLVVGEFVVRRQQGMGLAVALDLRHFVERFPARALLDVVLVDLVTVISLVDRKHPAVRQVAVVRQRECLAVGLAFVVFEPFVQVERIGGAERRLRGQRHDLLRAYPAVAQHDVAVQVESLRHRGPFVADEGGKVTRLVIGFGGVDDALPDVLENPRIRSIVGEELLGHLHLRERLDQVERGRAGILAALSESLGPLLALRFRDDVRRSALDVGRHAHQVAVIGDHQPVERSPELDRQAGRRLDFLAAGKAIGILGAEDIAEQAGVER